MSPMVKRIAQRVRHGPRPRQKFLIGRGVSGRISFSDAVGAHRPPFVVVALEPNFEEIIEAAIFGDILGNKMAMVIDDRLRGGELIVKSTSSVVREQKIFAEEVVHRGVTRETAESDRAIQARNHISSTTP